MTTTTPPHEPQPRKIAHYPIAKDETGGSLFLYGETNAANIVLLCTGFPDDHETLLPLASRLAKEANCLTGVMCLPGYDEREDRPWTSWNKDGYKFSDFSSAAKEAVKVLRKESVNESAKLCGIFHDWGIAVGTTYTNLVIEEGSSSLIPKKIVYLDVLPNAHPEHETTMSVPKTTLFETVTTWSYRYILALAFFTQRYISKALAPLTFLGFGVLGLFGLTPTLAIDDETNKSRKKPLDPHRLCYMAYPYFNVLFGRDPMAKYMTLHKDLKSLPVLYMYGLQKRIMFHDKKALCVLKEEEKNGSHSKVKAVSGAGHWLHLHQPDFCTDTIKSFLLE